MKRKQMDLFSADPPSGASTFPPGFAYAPDLITPAEHATLLGHIPTLPFTEFLFQGFVGKRRTVSFGWHYDFSKQRLEGANDIPDFLLSLREQAAHFAGLPASSLVHVLVTEYSDGAGIGWHRDKAVFGDVIGISLRAPCTFRLRKRAGDRWLRASLVAEPRSVYLLRGAVRTEWEHSIPGVAELRYSITFRTLKAPP